MFLKLRPNPAAARFTGAHWCGLQAMAFTAAWCSWYLSTGEVLCKLHTNLEHALARWRDCFIAC